MDEVTERLMGCLRANLRLLKADQDLDPAADLKQWGLDSMSAINLILDLERTFGVTFPDELISARTLRNAASLEESIRSLLDDESAPQRY